MDRHQLHGGRVGVEAAGALGAAAGRALGDLAAQPGQQSRPGRAARVSADLVQRLADVAQVGEPPLAADPGRARARAAPRRSPPRAPRRRRACANTSAQARSVSATSSVRSSPPASSSRGGVPEEAGERGGPDPRAAVRLLERLEQGQPLDRRGRSRTRCRHRRSPPGRRPRAAPAGPRPEVVVAVARSRRRRAARADGPRTAHPTRAGRGRRARGRGAMWGRTWPTSSGLLPPLAERRSRRTHPQPERRVTRRAGEPGLLVVGLDVVHDDPLVAERGAGEHASGSESSSGCVAAPVDGQRLLRGRGLGAARRYVVTSPPRNA